MSSICILTDSAAQFPQYGFPGKNDVRVIPYDIELNGVNYEEGRDLKLTDFPAVASESSRPRLITPSIEKFQNLLVSLGTQYRDVIVLPTSSSMTSAFGNAQKAFENIRGKVRVTLIDSQTTSIGLGLLVQNAAEAAANGVSSVEIERLIRSLIPHTYLMFCTPAMSYLHYASFIDSSQAFVGEMLGVMPIFTLEEGLLSPVEKVRNMRGLVDFMQEFLLEFDDLQHIAFIQSNPPAQHEARLMREHVQSCFPQTPFSEQNINLPLAAMLGPRTLGLAAVEKLT